MPWQLVFLLGSGFAISKGSNVSGLAMKIGQALVPLKKLHPVLMLTVVLVIVNTMTEFTSNVGTANILLPIVAHMVRGIARKRSDDATFVADSRLLALAFKCTAMEIHPLYLMMPVTLMCSYAFRLPIATPGNSIITVTGRLPTSVLMAAGCFPAFYSVLVQVILFPTWGVFVYGIGDFPDWASRKP